MSTRALRILEIIWIVIGVICIAGAIRSVIINDTKSLWVFLIMAAISFIFAMIRHNQRKRS